jgi:hypothetical protein
LNGRSVSLFGGQFEERGDDALLSDRLCGVAGVLCGKAISRPSLASD